jgi:hypothetical protein
VARKRADKSTESSGKLRIGNMWNAITIIALSQTNPLKAVAEFVENSIDAGARNITIIRGKEKGDAYIRIKDDGKGIPADDEGRPDYKYVATHICDSIKRHVKEQGATGIQGEFGIGLLSFWTVGEALTLTGASEDGQTYEMRMVKGDPGYTVRRRRLLFPEGGTELTVSPLLSGLRQLSGEKIQWFLASELRDRIRTSGVKIKVVDHTARKEFKVEPRQFKGRLLHDLPGVTTSYGELYMELYLTELGVQNSVGLYRSGTRVLDSLGRLDALEREPWTTGHLEGIIDAPFLSLTPGTRDGIIRDEAFAAFCSALAPVEAQLTRLIEEQREAEEQRASKRILRSIQKALREALLALPVEEYDWFDIRSSRRGTPAAAASPAESGEDPDVEALPESAAGEKSGKEQPMFFEYAGPLFSARISPSSSVVPVSGERNLRAVARDRSRRSVKEDLLYAWNVAEGGGDLSNRDGECATYTAPSEPGLARIEVLVTDGTIECRGEALITVTDTLIPETKQDSEMKKGLPGYTYHSAPAELWRSRYDADQNVIVINNGHRDFVYAARNRPRKLRYISRLFAKELVIKNFPGTPPDQLLERMIELTLYVEENLR